ncbi:MAG: transporter [Bacteroidetes bacterium GWE2_41_25]|nr:MAG: transporter [Bacteroidetes bacterium GWA2_40_15]OFX95848.1 MAG: transporter [Bacteroidetes bacterium GWE2_41_25]OFX98999.1 MAG: transporter [Bacteroidetes bacterium GWC2_40_22]OFY61667.1 MAG: transporter [Bacteroidetes bacterium GWF2_41_9]HBH85405.1 putative transporter [Bacteroidales bacterium]
MNWLYDLLWHETVAHTILIYCLVIVVGVFLGKIRFFGVSLGITFVLFAGLTAGHFGLSANHRVIDFIRDFGLILFVFSIGLQVGPGFFSSFRKGGLSLNILALIIVLAGGLTTVTIHFITGASLPMLVGVMSGAVTNTPGLGAAQQALAQVSEGIQSTGLPDIALGYAVAYPFGVLGIILTMLIIKKVLSVNIRDEVMSFNQVQHPSDTFPEKISIQVTNPQIFNKSIHEISKLIKSEIVVSRVLHNGELIAASSDTLIYENDIILVVTQKGIIPEVIREFGTESDMDLTAKSGRLVTRRIMVTNHDVFGKKLGYLKLRTRYNINITRVYRSGIELLASPQLRLQMGDRLTIVGDEKSMEKVIEELGNSIKRLNEPNLVPIFLGILAGVVLGSIPIHIPGIVNPVKLGLAGGPLIVAILLSKYGYKFSLVSYTTPSSNLMIREIGIVLFLASVGIASGEKFMSTLVSGDGVRWMGYGAVITFLPLILVGLISRIILKKNYLEICGLLSGGMTDPPALAYANSIAQSEAPSVAYATVYPLVMFLRIFVAQLLILLFVQ